MKFSFLPVAITLLSAAYAAPSTQPAEHAELVARGNCGTSARDCQCSALFDKFANPASLGSTVSARISGADRGLTSSDWRGSDGQNRASLCRVTVDRVCGDCSAWKTTTDKCGFYGLTSFSCIPA